MRPLGMSLCVVVWLGCGSSGDSGTTKDMSEAIQAQCEKQCVNQYSLPCAPAAMDPSNCEAMCGTKVLQMSSFCHSENLALNKCQAKSDYYYCMGDQVASKGGCQEEGLALQACQVDVPCQEICAAKSTLGCSEQSTSKCVKACNAAGEGEWSDCKMEVRALNQCQASNATACSGEELAIADACAEKVLDISGCLFNSNVLEACDAWCVAAQSLGCGDSCVDGCEAALEDDCGDAFEQIMECAFGHGNAECIDNALLGTGSCDDEVEDWHACLAGELE